MATTQSGSKPAQAVHRDLTALIERGLPPDVALVADRMRCALWSYANNPKTESSRLHLAEECLMLEAAWRRSSPLPTS